MTYKNISIKKETLQINMSIVSKYVDRVVLIIYSFMNILHDCRCAN